MPNILNSNLWASNANLAVGYSGAVAKETLPMLKATAVAHDATGDYAAALTLPTLTAGGFGGAVAALALPMVSAAVKGTATINGSLAASLPAAKASGTGTAASGAAGNPYMALPMAQMIGYGGAVLSTSLGAVVGSGTGTAGSVGTAAVTLPMFDLVATGSTVNQGAASLILPMLKVGATIQAYMTLPTVTLQATGSAVVTATYEAYAVNLASDLDVPEYEVTHYTNFPFDKVVRYKNSYFGVSATGLYLLEGTTDNSTPINYEVKTAITDFGVPEQKTVVSAYFGGRLGPAETITLYSGEGAGNAYAYTTPRGASAQSYRQKFGNGIKARYYAMGVSGAGAFALDTVDLEIKKLTRRI